MHTYKIKLFETIDQMGVSWYIGAAIISACTFAFFITKFNAMNFN